MDNSGATAGLRALHDALFALNATSLALALVGLIVAYGVVLIRLNPESRGEKEKPPAALSPGSSAAYIGDLCACTKSRHIETR
ncbi:hypothetical protein ACFZCY_25995 [Streptomyces sp. NPDC007983]|uniref:hypothetical protein n=1 Tax=Streptomyces sp. NPDC007983 TaxID=3364800 RepID=UPI0036EEC808